MCVKKKRKEDRPRFSVTRVQMRVAWAVSGVGRVAGECTPGCSGPWWHVARQGRRTVHHDSRNAARLPVRLRSAAD